MRRVLIYKLTRAFDVNVWLCAACLKVRKAEGWLVVEKRELSVPQSCDDCGLA